MTSPSKDTACWACGSRSTRPIFEVTGIPLSSLILMETRQEARSFPRGDLRLVVCEMCGFIFNASFVPELVDYTLPYESSQDFSPRFRVFKQELIDHLISRYDLSGKEILEIGCGDASFLEALCEQADARGFGIDPNFDVDRLHETAAIRGIREFYGPDQVALTGNLICCRHTLEHIQPVGEFVALARQSASLTPDAVVFFEIPDTERILDEGAFWDVYYEHCSYFTLSSLGNLFRSKGFDVLRLDKGYDDQYLLIDTVVGNSDRGFEKTSAEEVLAGAERFKDSVRAAIDRWNSLISDAALSSQTVVLWGASSKAVAFLASLEDVDAIHAAVDINPYKQDMYLPGSGMPVIGPAELQSVKPDSVIVMNPIYVEEIRQTLEEMNLRPDIHALGVDPSSDDSKIGS